MVNNDSADKNNNFIKEVAKYFMNFLETDFHKTRLPKRNSISKIVKWYKVWLDLEKYKKLKKDFYTIFYNGFKKDSINIKKWNYTSTISEHIFKLISSKIKNLDEELLKITFNEIELNLKDIKKVNIKNYQLYLEKSQETIQTIFTKHFIVPFLDTIEEPLQTLELVDQNWLYQIEWELSDSLYSVFENILLNILQSYFEYNQNKKENIWKDEKSIKEFSLIKELEKNISLDELKANIELFFKNISVSDAFDDIYILFKNNKLLDKTELYLYMYEISAWKHTFPLFYLPLKLEEKKWSFELIFDQKLYVNTKAIDYVVQEYNRETPDSSWTLAWNYDRIIYINDEDNFIEKIKWIVDSIQNFFKFTRTLEAESPDYQKTEHLISWFSNKSYVYLFDKSDESVINDYEEILNNNEWILDQFSLLLNDFIESNPVNFEEEINDEWQSKTVSNKLIFESPIPLNDEQKQVVTALWKKDCKVLTLEWPPWTWKSHTITAIICKALLDAKSVLVLSDKKEALDVVEEKITETLNKVRKDDDFLNPILRLWKSWNKFWKIVQWQTINKIAEHYSAYKHKKPDLDKEKESLLKLIEENLEKNISYFQDISLKELNTYYSKYKQYNDIKWYSSDQELEINLLDLKRIISKISDLHLTFEISNKLVWESEFMQYTKYIELLKELQNINVTFIDSNSQLNIGNLPDLIIDSNYNKEKKDNILETQKKVEEFQELFADENLVSYLYDIDITNKVTYENIFKDFTELNDLIVKVQKYLWENFDNYKLLKYFELEKFDSDTISRFTGIIKELKDLKRPIIWYLFQKNNLDKLYRKIKLIFPYLDYSKVWNIEEILEVAEELLIFVKDNINNDIFIQKWNLLLYVLSNEVNSTRISELVKNILDTYEEYKLDNDLLDLQKELLIVDWYINVSDVVEEIRKTLIDIHELLPNKLSNSSDVYLQFVWDDDIYKDYQDVKQLREYIEDLEYIESVVENYPQLSENIKLKYTKENIAQISSELDRYDEEFVDGYVDFKRLHLKIINQFNNFPEDIFSDGIKNVEDQTTAEMAYFLDKRIVEYTRNYSKEVNTLKGIISKKKKFPNWLFVNLKNAFPCILAWIRDYSDYIPLERDLFDLIIIDEASQVSIAQSLPALIRWKKIIILWDDKQFSNVKSNNASKIVNQEYKTNVRRTFIEERLDWKDDEFGWLENVWNFDIKYSILKFSQSIQNYKCQLRKHFRWYPEIISYSNKFFYEWTLQCMKIRGKSIEDVIKMDVIPHDWLIDTAKNTNQLEVDYIIEKILEFKSKWIKQSLWIITPHQHQASLLQDKISELPEKDWIFKTCKLKIMTFDSCQWEERDYIFYSMVATEEKDRLTYIFIKDLKSIESEENWSVKAQRMNVWFSRARECMHFVLSKPVENFSWEIKNALLHYKNELEAGKKVKLWWTDENSPMEKKIQEYFYETQFYKDNNGFIEFIPQFDIWKYLRQLDRWYNHPAYKVDFLLIYNNKKVVIEYDGFKEHFEDLWSVDKYNYESYMKSDDIYRQKVLEWYGYKFLRINRFNIWENPVETLNTRLNELFKKKRLNNEWLEDLYEQIDKLQDWDERACISCGKIFESKYFPYKTKNQCVNCYEKKHWKTLRTFRQRLNYYERTEENLNDNNVENATTKLTSLNCPTCNSTNVKGKWYRNDKKRLLCDDCGKNWSISLDDVVDNTQKIVDIRKEDTFKRENSIKEIMDYLRKVWKTLKI